MTGNDLIGCLTSKTSPPYPVFIFRDENRQILGEYDPHLGGNSWVGGYRNNVLDREVLTWHMTWDQQDNDVVQLWITVKKREGGRKKGKL